MTSRVRVRVRVGIENAFAVKGQKPVRLCISRLKKGIILKAFVRDWVRPAFLLGANLDTKV